MPTRNLQIITKIIMIYSLFLTGLKIMVIFRGAWLEANLVLALPFFLLAIWGGFILKAKRFSWFYAISGILTIGLMRYFEKALAVEIHTFFIPEDFWVIKSKQCFF